MIEDYLIHAQQLCCLINCDPGALQELLHLIETSKDKTQENVHIQNFFKGEYAFYTDHYENALRHYLEAKEIPNFEFFCYRASAYALKEQSSLEKSVEFARRALKIFPDDYPTLAILNDVLMLSGDLEGAREITKKMRALESSIAKKNHIPIAKIEEISPQINIGKKEIKELAGIFSIDAAEETLFTETSFLGPESFAVSLDFSQDNKADCSSSFHSILMDYYIKGSSERKTIAEDSLYIFQGWNRGEKKNVKNVNIPLDMLYDGSNESSGGFYLRWQGRGVVINPGHHFMTRFHEAGLYIQDIDFVIVTDETPNAYVDIQKIYELQGKVNQELKKEPQVIHYYLNHKVYQKFSNNLKPRSKHERHALHKLELFLDSPEGEEIELNKEIKLHYFPALITQESRAGSPASGSVEIRLELSSHFKNLTKEQRNINVGYSSNVAGMNGICASDILILRINEHYRYSQQIGSEELDRDFASRKLVLCTDFDAFNGDVRLETIKKMRIDTEGEYISILPADIGLLVDLKTMQIECSSTHAKIDPDAVHIVKTNGPFSRLQYLSPNDCL